jgi:2-hydroxy-3-oxopropionate reductase
MKLGFIGLGIMGAPMAQHLLAAGHEMFVRTRSKVPEGLQGATVCATNADVARAAARCTDRVVWQRRRG